MGKADLHIHSTYSWDGTASIKVILKHVAQFTDLDVIAITDHDVLKGAILAAELSPVYGVQVVSGMEISTADGHLLALFLKRPVPSGLPLFDTLVQVGAQGGLCIAAHPMASGAHSLTAASIQRACLDPQARQVFVGIEVYNAGLFHRRSNMAALALGQTLPLAHVGNSDAHILRTIGEGSTQFDGHTLDDLRKALVSGTTQVIRGRRSSSLGVVGGWLQGYLLRSARLATR